MATLELGIAIPQEAIASVNSKHKDQLSGIVRYSRFMAPTESPADWQRLLGPDVIGLTHPDVTSEIAGRFMDFNSEHGLAMTTGERVLLLTASAVHDWGELKIEGRGVGDIPFDQKTETDEQEEMSIFQRLREDIGDGAASDLINQAYTQVVEDRSTRLGRMFNAVERIGYLQTGIRAYQGVDGTRIANWQGLAGNVLSNQIIQLLEYRKEYPYVEHYLEQMKDTIDQMLRDIVPEPIPLDNTGNPSYDPAKLEAAARDWAEF